MTTAVYVPALTSGDSVYEDAVFPLIAVKHWRGVGVEVRDVLWHPDRQLDLLSRRVIGTNPYVGRAVSFALHLLIGLLVYRLAQYVFPDVGALLALALFWLHPIQSEAVAYMAARGDLWMALWVVLALLACERGWLTLSLLCAFGAITAKEMGVVALGLVPWWAWYRGQDWTHTQRSVWLGALTVGFLAVNAGAHARGLWQWAGLSYIAGQIAELGRMLLLWPEALIHPSALTIDHDWYAGTPLLAWSGVAAMALMMIVSGWLRFSLGFALIASWPRLVLPLLDGQHERHVYVASIAMSVALAALVTREPVRA